MNRRFWKQRAHTEQIRLGAILVLSAFFLVVVLAFIAFAVDVGFIALTKTQMQAAADAAALSASMELSTSEDPSVVRSKARTAAREVSSKFRNGDLSAVQLSDADIVFGRQISLGNGNYHTLWGDQHAPHNIVKVIAQRGVQVENGQTTDNRLPLFFGPFVGTSKTNLHTEAVATFQPRDIMLVLDFSSSMNDDSCLAAIGSLGRAYVESNLEKMWQQLGSPSYGQLTFQPEYATLRGGPQTSNLPLVTVTYKRTSVVVTSTSPLLKVTLKLAGNRTQTFPNLSGTTGTFAGTGSNGGRDIQAVYVHSGGNLNRSPGALGELFTINSATIKTALGLDIAYPYPQGSWDEFIAAVQSSSNDIKLTGYRDKYGFLTWLQYLQTERPSASETPDLWKTSEQPVTALKDAVDLFVDQLTNTSVQDQLGLSIYTHPQQAGAILEHELSNNYGQVKTTTRQRQAGHYVGGTNISAGMATARQEIALHGRDRAFKLMVLMTDGRANAPGNAATARQAVLQEAYAARSAGIKICTVAVGISADTALMTDVASIAQGEAFIIPGGQSVPQMQAQLLEAFRRIAHSRPLKLIQ